MEENKGVSLKESVDGAMNDMNILRKNIKTINDAISGCKGDTDAKELSSTLHDKTSDCNSDCYDTLSSENGPSAISVESHRETSNMNHEFRALREEITTMRRMQEEYRSKMEQRLKDIVSQLLSDTIGKKLMQLESKFSLLFNEMTKLTKRVELYNSLTNDQSCRRGLY